ncbi:MAG: dihydrolipoyl dehydrogenase [Gaiellaceae bacterium]|jgi:dihydrolipoamide dehydrogenase
MEFDVAVLGAGPGGYPAAIRAAQLGAKVVCIEQEPALGGVCLRVGCIPTKTWVQTARAIKEIEESYENLGIHINEASLDFGRANAWKANVVERLTGGVASLFKANGVEWVKGFGRFTGPHTIAVEGSEEISFKSAIVATGSHPLVPPIPGIDSERCVDPTGLLAQTEVPARLVILGGGVIGCEFASIFSRFGSKVAIIELLERLLPMEDEDVSKELAKNFFSRGIELHLGKTCSEFEQAGGALRVHFGEGETVEADLVLVSVGRAPSVEDIGLEAAGVSFDLKNGIKTDEHRRTNVPHIYAAGDVAGHWQLAHTAFYEGEVAAENATGNDAVVGTRAVPRPIYTEPEVAAVGLTEAEARARYGDELVAVGRFPWVANGRALIQGETSGWVKTIHESRYGELLGLVVVGPHATELIEVGRVAIDAESTIETLSLGISAHPTLSEAIKEAGLVALGRPLHVAPRRRAR